MLAALPIGEKLSPYVYLFSHDVWYRSQIERDTLEWFTT